MDRPVSPSLRRARSRNRWLVVVGLVVLVASLALAMSTLGPALPSVERAALHVGAVKRGAMVRDVRGSGTLVPEQIRFVQAESEGRVERILVAPGAAVHPDTLLLVLGNAELDQAAFDAEWQLRGAMAQLDRLRAQLESDELGMKASLAALETEASQADLDAAASERLAEEKLISGVDLRRSLARAEGLRERRGIERERLTAVAASSAAQLSVQRAEVERARAWLARKREQVAALHVRAGVEGVLEQTGDTGPLQVGQRISPGDTLAKIVEPTGLKAVLKIPETQAKDLQLDLAVTIDTRNGTVPGRVVRIDPSARSGTVTVEVRIEGALPKGARPESSVDGVIELERLPSVLYVGRPVQAQQDTTVGLFRVTHGVAERVPVRLGRSSVSVVEIVEGLAEGDEVVLSDMTEWMDYERIRLK